MKILKRGPLRLRLGRLGGDHIAGQRVAHLRPVEIQVVEGGVGGHGQAGAQDHRPPAPGPSPSSPGHRPPLARFLPQTVGANVPGNQDGVNPFWQRDLGARRAKASWSATVGKPVSVGNAEPGFLDAECSADRRNGLQADGRTGRTATGLAPKHHERRGGSALVGWTRAAPVGFRCRGLMAARASENQEMCWSMALAVLPLPPSTLAAPPLAVLALPPLTLA